MAVDSKSEIEVSVGCTIAIMMHVVFVVFPSVIRKVTLCSGYQTSRDTRLSGNNWGTRYLDI